MVQRTLEGETLVVMSPVKTKTPGLIACNFHSEALHVVERYTPRSADILTTKPPSRIRRCFRAWKISMPLYRRVVDARLLEYKCVEFAEEVVRNASQEGQQQEIS